MTAARAEAMTGARRIWVLAGEKPGDNAQALSLAEALGWQTEVKQLRYLKGKKPLAAKLSGSDRFPLDRAASSPLVPPWPDLVIGCGRRSVPIAWDIRRQAGPTTRLVQLGRPRADLDGFDLVVTSPQYRLPARPNVLHLALPLHRPEREKWASAAAEWEARLGHLPRPWVALMVGGSAKPFVFDVASARRLATQVNALVRGEGGSLLVSTSRRTPADAASALVGDIDVPSFVHEWQPGGGPNPYLAYLGLADAFVVTGDSASMLTEACSTGKRVWIVALPERRSLKSRGKNLFRNLVLAPTQDPRLAGTPIARALSAVPARGWVRYPRDLKRLHAALIAEHRALPLGTPFPRVPPPPVDETELAVARVRALFDH